jgi:hypothetical protein
VRSIKAASADASKIRSPEQERYTAALERLVENLKEDRSVIAALLCGSLSHDTVWAKSDIDLLIVTADEKSDRPALVALDADGIAVHAQLTTRTEFRRAAEGARHGDQQSHQRHDHHQRAAAGAIVEHRVAARLVRQRPAARGEQDANEGLRPTDQIEAHQDTSLGSQ